MNVQDYINKQPVLLKPILSKLRKLILNTSNDIIEDFTYGMPAYTAYGFPLVYFAVYQNHIGFYATPSPQKAFSKELKKYKQGKGSIQFPINEPLPFLIIEQLVQYKLNENKTRYEKKFIRICKQGHSFIKSIDCPLCPVCEASQSYLSSLSAPVQRALQSQGIKTLKQLSSYSESELLKLHGIGPSSIPKLKSTLKRVGLSLKKL